MQGPPELSESGVIERGVHLLPIRVWFEDVDVTGVAHHPAYLRWMERARIGMIEHAGVEVGSDGYWAVADLAIRYRRPARLDDRLTVESRVARVRAAATEIDQRVRRGAETLSAATVTVAYLDPRGRPRRQPAGWTARFAALAADAVA